MIEFTDDELNKLDYALAYYIDERSVELSHNNSRDVDWDRLLDYQKLSRKIVDYVIEQSQSCTDHIAD